MAIEQVVSAQLLSIVRIMCGEFEVRGARRPGGMTLIEVLVATILLGVGVTGLMSAATMAIRHQHRSVERTTAAWLANERLSEVARIGPYAWSVSRRPMEGTEPAGAVSYAWTLDIEPASDGLIGELYIVNVEVTWKSAGGRGGGTVAMETWLNDYEAVALTPKDQRERSESQSPTAPRGG